MMQQIDDLILIKQLGKGGFGQVYLSQKKNSNKYFATKKLNKAESDTKYRRYLLYEINILKTLNHPNWKKLKRQRIIIILLWNLLMEVNYQNALKNIN